MDSHGDGAGSTASAPETATATTGQALILNKWPVSPRSWVLVHSLPGR
jgi:hypothetical protein